MTLESLIRDSFAAGYSLYDDEVDDRARLACLSAIEASADEADPAVLDLVYEAAKRQGLTAQCEKRRRALSAHFADEITAITPKIAKKFPSKGFVRRVMAQMKRAELTEASKTKRRQNAAKSAAVLALRSTLTKNKALASELRTLAAEARASAMAEGEAQAVALVNAMRGGEALDINKLYGDTLTQLRKLDTYWSQADSWVSDQIKGLSGDIGKSIANSIENSVGRDQMLAALNDVIAMGDGAAFYLDEAIHTAMQGAAVGIYSFLGIGTADFQTADDDHVCPTCEGYEASNPWDLASVPTPPIHGGCRCWVNANSDSSS